MVDDQFVEGKQPAASDANDCELSYESFPDDDSYVHETNWSRIEGLDKAVKMVTKRLG